MTRISTGIASLDGNLYAQLRRLAGYYMRMERSGHTLQPTALVHEAYLRVYGIDATAFDDSKQILYSLVRAMREILIDHARRNGALKRTRPANLDNSAEDHSHSIAAEVMS